MKKSDRQRLSALTAFAKGELKVKAKRASPMKGKKLKTPEADFRNKEFLPYLKKHAYAWFRIENKICGKHGKSITDFIAFFEVWSRYITKENMDEVPPLIMVLPELKSKVGTLSDGQKTFKKLIDAVIKPPIHVRVRSIEDIETVRKSTRSVWEIEEVL